MSGEFAAEDDPDSRPESIRYEHRRTPKRAYLMGLAGLVIGIFAGYSIGAQSIPPAPVPSVPSPHTLKSPTDTSIPGEGEFLVGTGRAADVRPGLYHSSRNQQVCSWQREKDATGEHIIASDRAEGGTYVQLRAGEFFDTSGCTTWHRVNGPGAPG
jgi:hypothetical protein